MFKKQKQQISNKMLFVSYSLNCVISPFAVLCPDLSEIPKYINNFAIVNPNNCTLVQE